MMDVTFITECFYDLKYSPWEQSDFLPRPVNSQRRQVYLERSAVLENLAGP